VFRIVKEMLSLVDHARLSCDCSHLAVVRELMDILGTDIMQSLLFPALLARARISHEISREQSLTALPHDTVSHATVAKISRGIKFEGDIALALQISGEHLACD